MSTNTQGFTAPRLPEGVIIVTTVSFTFNTNVEEFASSHVSTTLQLFPSPSNCRNVYPEAIGPHHPVGVKSPRSTGNSEEPDQVPRYFQWEGGGLTGGG